MDRPVFVPLDIRLDSNIEGLRFVKPSCKEGSSVLPLFVGGFFLAWS